MHQVFDRARNSMVDGQVRPNKVTDPNIIEAMRRIPRERFVPRHLQSMAYVDEDIHVGKGRYLPEPMVIARLLQAAEVKGTDIALVVGSGMGYAAALVGCLAGTVVGIEQDAEMTRHAEGLLHDLGIVNGVVIQRPDIREGYVQQGPYDVIVINGSVPAVPETIRNQLAEGGRLVTVLSEKGHMGAGVLIVRSGEDFTSHTLFDAATPTLAGFEAPKAFVF